MSSLSFHFLLGPNKDTKNELHVNTKSEVLLFSCEHSGEQLCLFHIRTLEHIDLPFHHHNNFIHLLMFVQFDVPPNGPWYCRGINNHLLASQFKTGLMPNNFHSNAVESPFIHASVTPLAQIQGTPIQPYNQQVPPSIIPPSLSSLLHPQPEITAQLPSSPPSLVPPLPSSPPPPPLPCPRISQYGMFRIVFAVSMSGNLCKSGVNYCTI
ncbi:hypothetical protein Fmac_032337 [Flemingia macrophylla]|uniref:Uncharacterized protein n=1 Tax=Flemingia macrophylla TaxID=520843 RepID=A0ABD1L4L1_9FABA